MPRKTATKAKAPTGDDDDFDVSGASGVASGSVDAGIAASPQGLAAPEPAPDGDEPLPVPAKDEAPPAKPEPAVKVDVAAEAHKEALALKGTFAAQKRHLHAERLRKLARQHPEVRELMESHSALIAELEKHRARK